jgi:hypothetical protein
MKLHILIISLIICSYAKTQNLATEPLFRNTWRVDTDTCDIRCYLGLAFDRDSNILNFKKQQFNFVACFKFNIDTLGNVVNITGNTVTPLFLFTYIDSLLKTTNGKWIPSYKDGKKVMSKPLLLPVIFLNEKNLGLQPKTNIKNFDYYMLMQSYTLMTSFDSIPHYESKPNIKSNQKFNSTPWLSNDKGFDCYLLKPVSITPNQVS